MRARWKWLIAAPVVLAGAWGALRFAYAADEDPPADEDLVPEARALQSDGENGYAVLVALPFPVKWPEGRRDRYINPNRTLRLLAEDIRKNLQAIRGEEAGGSPMGEEVPQPSWLPGKNALGVRFFRLLTEKHPRWVQALEEERPRLAEVRAVLEGGVQGKR